MIVELNTAIVVFGVSIWVFPKIVVPKNGWFIMENHIKMDDLGGFNPLFSETPISRPLKSVGHVTCLDLFVFEGGGVEAEVEVAEKSWWKLETGIYQP